MKEIRAYHRLKALHPDAHWQRVEGHTLTGASDTNACRRGTEIWVECKEAALPKKKTTLIKAKKVRPSQIAWTALALQASRKVFVALMIENQMYVLHGSHIKELRDGISLDWIKASAIDPLRIFDDGILF